MINFEVTKLLFASLKLFQTCLERDFGDSIIVWHPLLRISTLKLKSQLDQLVDAILAQARLLSTVVSSISNMKMSHPPK